MGNYQIRIELISDLCVSDGGVYNSSLDTDICYDSLGFPLIPAKRLKGCLRECAKELEDWGIKWKESSFSIKTFFGDEGNQSSKIRIEDARLEDYNEMRSEVENNSNHGLFHPQNVLQHFSYIRTQTAVDYETNVADNTSLRTMRVVNKGLVFIARVQMKSCYYKDFASIVSILSHMGIARTRGFGEVQASLKSCENHNNRKKGNTKKRQNFEIQDHLVYSIELKEPLICKSVDGAETKSMDYIEGSKILGIVAQEYKKRKYSEDFIEFLNQDNLIFSNAYLEKKGQRLTEVPAAWYGIKNNDQDFIDKIYQETESGKKKTEGQQLNSIKHCYVFCREGENVAKYDVKLEERYHHRRPEDKSIGRATEDNMESQFYEMSSIAAGQFFQGYIFGSKKQLAIIAECLSEQKEYCIGYSHSAEYGRVYFQFHEEEIKQWRYQENVNKKEYQDFLVKLEAPVIVYNEKQIMYSTLAEDLLEEIFAVLHISKENQAEAEVQQKFINYTSVGGFNVTWGKRKPILEAFDKGTVLKIHFKDPICLPMEASIKEPATIFLGERTLEGYGEAIIYPLLQEDNYYLKMFTDDSKEEYDKGKVYYDVSKSAFGKEISDELFAEYLTIRAIEKAREKEIKNIEADKPTVSNMLLMCKEQKTLDGIEDAVKKRFSKTSYGKDKKLQAAEEILSNVKEMFPEDGESVLLQDFEREYQIKNFEQDQEKNKLRYLEAYLVELKYMFRQKEKNRNLEEDFYGA